MRADGKTPWRHGLLSAVALSGLLLANGAAAGSWKIIEENADARDGYVLSRRQVEGSHVIEFKITGVVRAPVAKVAEAAWQTTTDPGYAQKDERREILEREGDRRCTVYHYYEAPAVVADRDVVTLVTRQTTPGSQVHRILWTASDDDGPPPPDGVVRMPRSEGSWELAPTAEGFTIATYRGLTDPGGSIPTWLVNGSAPESLVRELDNLRKVAGP